jgi:hypothetical protein
MTGRRRTGRHNSRRRWTVPDASPSISPALRIKRKDRGTGANLGARPHSRPCTTTDAHGAQTAALSVKADPLDQSGRLVETYGSVSVGGSNPSGCAQCFPLSGRFSTNRTAGSLAHHRSGERFREPMPFVQFRFMLDNRVSVSCANGSDP